MAKPVQVGIVGMRALRRDVDNLTGDAGPLNRALTEAGRHALEPVAAAVREAYPRSDNDLTGHSGQLAGDVRVTASKTGAAIRVGRKAIAYAGPVDFGGYPGDRAFVKDGRYLYPTARGGGLDNVAATLYGLAVQRALDAFGWTNKTDNPEAVHD